MHEEEQNLSAAMRAARRSVWEQAKAAGIQNDETTPPAPTGKETGLNDDPRITTLEGIVRDLAGRLDYLEDDFPESETGNGYGSSAMYASYFLVNNASEYGFCKIGVTDGGWLGNGDPTYCGAVKINGTHVYVTAVKETVSSDGMYYVWIHSWVDSEGEAHAEIIVGDVNDASPPSNQNSGVSSYSSQLAGRVTVTAGVITAITQDYLHGGEHVELLYGNCFGDDDLL